MSYLYSPSTGGFYLPEVHGANIPIDAMQISEEVHAQLIAGNAQGKRIVPDVNGLPVLIDPDPAPAPSSVTMRQARLALLHADKLGMVTLAISSLPSPQKEAAQIEWEYAATVDRNSQLVAMLSAALGMAQEDLDQLFMLAATL